MAEGSVRATLPAFGGSAALALPGGGGVLSCEDVGARGDATGVILWLTWRCWREEDDSPALEDDSDLTRGSGRVLGVRTDWDRSGTSAPAGRNVVAIVQLRDDG